MLSGGEEPYTAARSSVNMLCPSYVRTWWGAGKALNVKKREGKGNVEGKRRRMYAVPSVCEDVVW